MQCPGTTGDSVDRANGLAAGSSPGHLPITGEMCMSDTSTYQLPVWAPRLSKLQIQRLYQSVGRDLLDEELVDDVGFSLYSRCISMLQVSEAIRG
jgi:hypothetical protein